MYLTELKFYSLLGILLLVRMAHPSIKLAHKTDIILTQTNRYSVSSKQCIKIENTNIDLGYDID